MIKLDDKYFIDSDNYSYQLVKAQGTDKDGKTIYKAISYHNNFYECIEKLLILKQRDAVKRNDNLESVLIEFKTLSNEMKSILNRIKEIESGRLKND